MRTLKAIEADIARNNNQYAALHRGALGRPHTSDEIQTLAALEAEFLALHAERLDAPLPGEESSVSPVSPVSDGLTSDDDNWSRETIEHVRATCPLSAVVAGVLDGFVTRGARITHASVAWRDGHGSWRVVRWHVQGEIRDTLFEVDIHVDTTGGYWTLVRGSDGKAPSVRVFRALGYEPNTDPHNRFHVEIEPE